MPCCTATFLTKANCGSAWTTTPDTCGGSSTTRSASDPNASMTLFSDHGMTPVTDRFDLVGAIDELGFSMPKDYLAVYDSTMARFWFFNPEARSEDRRSA